MSTKAEMDQLRSQILQVCAEDAPTTARFVYYRLLDPSWPLPQPKTQASYKRIAKQLRDMRVAGILPWEYIVDAGRAPVYGVGSRDAGEFLRSMAKNYRRSPWPDDGSRTEVWCEAKGTAPVLADTCAEWGVNLYPCGGDASLSFLFAAADVHRLFEHLHIVYVGDWDPKGLAMSDRLPDQLASFFPDEAPDIDLERVAVTEELVNALHLELVPITGSRRGLPGAYAHMTEKCEAEAVSSPRLRRLVSDALARSLPGGRYALADNLEKQAQEREHIGRLATLEQGFDA